MAPAAIAAAGLVVVLVAASISPTAGTDLALTSAKLETAVNGPAKLKAGVPLDNFTVPKVASAPVWDTTQPPPRVAVFGDSTGVADGYGLQRWGFLTGALDLVGYGAAFGCPIARNGEVRWMGVVVRAVHLCGNWANKWPRVIANKHPEVAVLFSAYDLADRLEPGDTDWRGIGDPTYDQYLYSEMLTATDLLLSHGLKVIWVTTPRIDPSMSQPVRADYPESNPARLIRFNKMMEQIAVDRPGVSIVDFRSYLRRRPNGELDPAERPDGVHFTDQTGLTVSAWLGPAILAAVRPVPTPTAPAPTPAPG